MDQHTLRRLRGATGYPSVSILMPTHRTHPANKQDPIQLKNLVRDAEERLLLEDSKRSTAAVRKALVELADGIDHEKNLDGLAIFVSDGVAEVHRLPFSVPPRAQVDETFALRDLVFAYNRSPHYYVLVLGEKPTRLYHAVRNSLEECRFGKFPLGHGGPGGGTRLPGGTGVNPSSVRDAHRMEFLREVDQELGHVLKHEDLPFAITGTEDFLADFTEGTAYQDRLLASIPGSWGDVSEHAVAEKVWPHVKDAFDRRRAEAKAELETAVGAGRYASGIVQVWEAARQGRVSRLIAEEDYRQAAILSQGGAVQTLVEDPSDPRAVDDLVDDAVEQTMAHGGWAIFADPGELAAHDRIAAITRF